MGIALSGINVTMYQIFLLKLKWNEKEKCELIMYVL